MSGRAQGDRATRELNHRGPDQLVSISVVNQVQGMVQAGPPEPRAHIFASFDSNTAVGGVGKVTDDYCKITGREQLPFEVWLQPAGSP